MKKKKKMTYLKNYDKNLENPAKAFAHIKAALKKGNKQASLLLALRDLAEARGLSQLSKDSTVDRAHLYTTLTETGDPRMSTLGRILDAFDLELTVVRKK